jgi:para-aminobenzoate synthetase component 1
MGGMPALPVDDLSCEDPSSVLCGGRDGFVFDGPAFGGEVPLRGVGPELILEGSWDSWAPLEEAWECGRAGARGEGGLAGWFDYEGNYRFGVFPSWSRGPVRYPATETRPPARFRAGLTENEWVGLVRRAHEYIAAGDIYQVNLTHTLSAEWNIAPGAFYRRFRGEEMSPCAAYLALGDTVVLSASPETFLRLEGRRITTRPIKGTRPRGADRRADAAAARELLDSPKERAELIMITDLLRNDLGQVCQYGTVQVPSLCALETFAHVHHLVSTVEGHLRPGTSPFAAVRACYPGGSITGAPKKRAREIITELERAPRGIYTGALGFVDWSGRAVFSIAIRTLVLRGGRATYGVGAGIVADSDPHREYAETWQKAAGLLAALGS